MGVWRCGNIELCMGYKSMEVWWCGRMGVWRCGNIELCMGYRRYGV